jgi:hypothetical protein
MTVYAIESTPDDDVTWGQDMRDFASGINSRVAVLEGSEGSVATAPRPLHLMVISAQAPVALKDAAVGNPYMFQCDGTGDQATINTAAALAAAIPATTSSYASPGGWGKVEFSAGAFDINIDPVNLHSAITYEGQGRTTELRARNLAADLGIFTTVDGGVHLSRVTNMWLNGNFATGNAHGVFYKDMVGSSFSGFPSSQPDSSNWLDHLHISGCRSSTGERHAIYSTGTGGGARACKISSIRAQDIYGHGVNWAGGSDTHFTDVEVTTEGGTTGTPRHGFMAASGNCTFTQCKAFYTEAGSDGFFVSSSRNQFVGCVAQDCGRYGFNLAGAYASVIGGQSDSSERLDQTAAGLLIAANNVRVHGLNIFDRNQTPASRQNHGVRISGAPTGMRLIADIALPATGDGSNFVIGTYATSGNIVSVLREGTTPLSFGY